MRQSIVTFKTNRHFCFMSLQLLDIMYNYILGSIEWMDLIGLIPLMFLIKIFNMKNLIP
jgi:hypothetical protein